MPANKQGLGLKMRSALEKSRAQESVPQPRFPDASLLMSKSRRAIFAELCRHPCIPSGELAKNIGLSRSNVEWHLDKMLAAGLITRTHLGGCVAYHVAGQIADDEVWAFTVLGNPVDRKIYLKVRERPGINQTTLSKAAGIQRQMLIWHLERLVRSGLIQKIQDGRLRLYRASPLLEDMYRHHAARTTRFKASLMRTLRSDHLEPSIVKVMGKSLLVRLSVGEKKAIMEVVTDPYAPYVKARKR